jgi:hypothetical protein
MATGITKRHTKGCPGRAGGRCNCGAGWEASIYSKRDSKKIRRTFRREAEAKSWRADALSALSKGALRTPKPTTVREAWEAWEKGVKVGSIRCSRLFLIRIGHCGLRRCTPGCSSASCKRFESSRSTWQPE